jgi:hypothetical protein
MSTGCLKHVEDSSRHIIEEIVCQVDYLPELYEDARSEKYKILWFISVFTRACYFSLFWARQIQFNPSCSFSVTHILTSLSHVRFGFLDPGTICIHPEVGEGNDRTYTGGFVR